MYILKELLSVVFKLSKKQIELISIVSILLTMFFVYSYDISNAGFGLWTDEASIGFNSYCISLSLHDYNNNFLPLYFDFHGGLIFRPPVYIYISAIIIKLFGFSLFTVKILGVICALIASLFTYLICRKVFNIYVAIIAFSFLLMSPGYFHIHRFIYELTTFGCFASGFVFFLLKSIENKSLKWGLLSFSFFVLAWFSYMPSRVYLLSLVLLSSLFFYKSLFNLVKSTFKQYWKYYLLFVALCLIFIVIPDVLYLKYVVNSPYSQQLMLFNQDLSFINENLFKRMPFAKDFLENIPLSFKKLIYAGHNYLITYFPDLLFLNADKIPRDIASGFGLLSLVGVILVPLGLFNVFKNLKEPQFKIILVSIISIGIPSLFLSTYPCGTHNSNIYIPFSILAGLGGYLLITSLSKFKIKYINSVFLVLIIISIVINFGMYLNVYHSWYKIVNQQHLLVNRDLLIKFIKDNQHKYKNIYVSQQIWQIKEHILFYGALDDPFYVKYYQEKRGYPYNIQLLEKDLYEPNMSLDNITNDYGENILMILNVSELKGHDDNSIRIFMHNNGNIFARAYEF